MLMNALVGIVIQQENIQRAMKSVEQGAASVVLAAIGKEYEGVGGVSLIDHASKEHCSR